MSFVASAPCKAILFGEHYVVYGASALSLPIEPRNAVKFGSARGALLKSALGSGRILPGGQYSGPKELLPYPAVARRIFAAGNLPRFSAEFLPAWKLKGVGTSASLCAAFAAGLLRLARKKATAQGIFDAAQQGDLVAHEGRASGIDAKTVAAGKPLVFRRSFSPQEYRSAAVDFSLPQGGAFLLVDTFAGSKEGTGKMLEKFAASFKIRAAPQDAADAERAEVLGEYLPLWREISRALKRATARRLGGLMDENHSLLKSRGMSSGGIERAIAAALSGGAYGAKLTGGGGEGGAVLALCSQNGMKTAARWITDSTSFACHPLSLAKSGAHAD